MREEMHAAIDADRVRRIAELEAERDELRRTLATKETQLLLATGSADPDEAFSSIAKDQKMIAVLKKQHLVYMEAIEKAGLLVSIGASGVRIINDPELSLSIALTRAAAAEEENARLRKIIEDAPHDLTCHSVTARHIPGLTHYETDIEDERCPRYHFKCGPCDCWKAALDRSPEAK